MRRSIYAFRVYVMTVFEKLKHLGMVTYDGLVVMRTIVWIGGIESIF